MLPVKPAVLQLANGLRYDGFAIGAIGTCTGEICYNTGMTGYYEIFTDPSYMGQIIVMTHTHIGNYGIGVQDAQSRDHQMQIAGLVCASFTTDFPSQYQNTSPLAAQLAAENKVGIAGIDTRALVLQIRQTGAMNAVISSEELDAQILQSVLARCASMEGLDLAQNASTKTYYSMGNPDASHRVAVLDFGAKRMILNALVERDCFVGVFPAQSKIEDMLAFGPQGVLLSNGPGDPAAMPYAVETVRELLHRRLPIFGICLGHQLLGLAAGGKTFKMFYGHRGINHPVKNLQTGLCEITSQNHGFALSNQLPQGVSVTHINLNDQSIEGIRLNDLPAFSVQYHPEAAPGPHDSRYLFDDFIKLLQSA